MFLSLAEKNDQNSYDLFEALDLGEESSEYFKEKCDNFPNTNFLVKLRDKRWGNEGRTLLHNAARLGHLPASLYLIRLSHEIEAIDSCLTKVTPLMDAISSRNVEIAIILVESGSKITTSDINGENALHYAARTGSVRMIKWLIKASNLSREDIQQCASATNIKLKFPEDLASTSTARDVLINFRQNGYHTSLFKRKNYKSHAL